MPGIVEGKRIDDQMISNGATSYYSPSSNNIGKGSVCCPSNGFWSKHRDDINNNQLQKFWSELSPQARQDLLRIDKQTLFEQARKNMYCSRCNGLLLEGFMQIVMYGKSLQHEGGVGKLSCHRLENSIDQIHCGRISTAVCQDETQDPSVHPWGGLITTRDGALTLLDSYLCAKSLRGLQNVFDSARARERERELLYPDACGGGGRGWISQGIPSYGRGHGTRETCALHTARLSCDTLVDFWSALGEETRQSLLKMKEEDFIERLMYRFDSKRFCRDCRRNVIREFKELKELKRMRREPRCTSWFCVADTVFQYEVSNDTIYADWHQTFADSIGTYHHFEWAVGSGEGKSDILEFENVGMNGSVRVDGLDLGDLTACYITLRAWKLDGRCTEFSAKAHALKGRHCVHCRLVVGDGYVTITHGESIRRFFEHAEEAEEEEDDDSLDKDGNDFDAECSRPQKHAKSPELAREFLLDAATVIFKEQVEKAFREGTARQNAHSIFVCLALKLLEERIHVACKEIVTLEKQTKLLEEEEKEKREEEERKERKRTKEREKKLRRKDRLREKEKDKKGSESSESPLSLDVLEEMSTSCIDEDANNCNKNLVSETGDTNPSPRVLDESSFERAHGECDDVKDEFVLDSLKGTRRKWSERRQSTDNGGAVSYKAEPIYHEEFSENLSKGVNCLSRQSRASASKLSTRNNGPRFGQKDRNELHSCGCNQQNDDYRAKVEPHCSPSKFNRETRSAMKTVLASDMPKPVHRINKFNQGPRSKILNYSNALGRDSPYTKKVWEPVEPQKRYPRCNSDSDVTLKSCSLKTDEIGVDKSMVEICSGQNKEETHGDSQGDTTLSSSSSDNCSSCLSEGDINSPSNHLNMESSSTSDSEDSSQQSEGRQSSVCAQNGLPEKMQNINGEETHLSSPFPLNVESHVSGNSSTKPFTDGVATIQGVLPSIQNQNISFPIFQGPSTVGYYHQSPVTWSTSPANGLMTYPHPNHYLFPSPFGYGPNRYEPVRHLPSPFMTGNQISVYQPVQRTNCMNPREQTREFKPNGVRDPFGESRRENVGPARNHPTDFPSKEDTGNTGFSLFQFGGPVAIPTYSSGIQSSDDGKGVYSCCRVEGDHVCSKKETTVEEYNLFAARNGIQFSIF